MQKRTLLKKLKKYKKLQAQSLELSVEMNILRAAFKKELKEQNIDELLVDEYKVSLLEYKRRVFDTDLFKMKHKKMYDNFSHNIRIESVVVS